MPGLKLQGTPVASKAPERRLQKAGEVLAEIKQEIRKMGMPDYPQPTTKLTPLSDVDLESLSDRDLGNHLLTYTAFASYTMPKVAELEAAYKISEMAFKQVIAELKLNLFKDSTAKSEIDARVQASPKYLEFELEKLKLYAMREILTAHLEAYQKQAAAISRVIEVRKMEHEMQARANNATAWRGNHPSHQHQRPAPADQGGLPGGIRRKT